MMNNEEIIKIKEVFDEDLELSPDTLERIRDIDMDYDLAVLFFKILAMEESRQKSRKRDTSQRYKEGEYKSL